MDLVYFTIVAITLYAFSDWALDRIERWRGRRFANRQVAFFAIILPLALAAFWAVRGILT